MEKPLQNLYFQTLYTRKYALCEKDAMFHHERSRFLGHPDRLRSGFSM